jgi:ferrous iron transport protein A
MPASLTDLNIGDKAIVEDIAENDLSLKLMDMGCLPGEEIVFVGTAPMGDPIMITIGGYLLSLRKSEAAFIKVKKVI